MGVLPELHAVDGRIERDLVSADVHEVVMTANHARRGGDDRVREVRTLGQRELGQPFAGEVRRAGRENRRKGGRDLHGFLDGPEAPTPTRGSAPRAASGIAGTAPPENSHASR